MREDGQDLRASPRAHSTEFYSLGGMPGNFFFPPGWDVNQGMAPWRMGGEMQSALMGTD